jgi:hypothetical protein
MEIAVSWQLHGSFAFLQLCISKDAKQAETNIISIFS